MALTNGAVYCRMVMHKAKIFEYAISRKSEFSSIILVDAGWFFEGLLVLEYATASGGFPLCAEEGEVFNLECARMRKSDACIAIAEGLGRYCVWSLSRPGRLGCKARTRRLGDHRFGMYSTSLWENSVGKKGKILAVGKLAGFRG